MSMPRTPQKGRSVGSLYRSPVKVIPLNGFFTDDAWHCNCQPRRPAKHYLVRKEGPNTGRGFYTCSIIPNSSGCGFFLWENEAETRAPGSYSLHRNSVKKLDGPSGTRQNGTGRANESLSETISGADEYGDWPLSREEESTVVATAEHAASNKQGGIPGAYPVTPRKTAKTQEMLAPGSKRKLYESTEFWPTPATERSNLDDVFTTPLRSSRGGSHTDWLRTPNMTPTPSRSRGATELSDVSEYDMTDEVMKLLEDQHVDADVSAELHRVLDKNAMKMAGIIRGRNITRVALKARDTKIAELETQLNELAATLEAHQVALKSEDKADHSIIKTEENE